MTVQELMEATRKPEPFEPGEELWNDPHISRHMLEAHLAPDTDAASYRPETIEAILQYLPEAMRLKREAAIIDLGCGPGLYCERLAAMGYHMTGIDRSERSTLYAREHASGGNPRYMLASYLEPFGENQFDAAIMVSQDYGVPCPENRRILLKNIRRALRSGGAFAFDVPSMAEYDSRIKHSSARWYASESGFWRPHPHFVLEDTLIYPDECVLCSRYVVMDDGGVKTYRVWQTYFSPESIRRELEKNGFRVEAVLSSLCGDSYQDASPVLGVICRKV
jgi:SAM-dependent methyltransferase